MAYNIIKHRRGTTDEWREIDLVPEDGELVIEECADGARKCKIGNGSDRFSKLPYVNDEVRIKLLKELDGLKSDFTSRISNIQENFTAQLSNTRQTLSKDLEDSKAVINSAIQSSNTKLKNDLQNEISKTVEEARTELATDIEGLSADITEKTDSLAIKVAALTASAENFASDTELTAAISSLEVASNKKLENALAEHSARFDQALTAQSETLTSGYETKVETTKQDLQKVIDQITTNQTSALEAVRNESAGALTSLANEWMSKLNDLKDNIKDANEDLQKTVTELSQQGLAFSESTLSQLKSLNTSVQSLTSADTAIVSQMSEYKNKSDSKDAEIEHALNTINQEHLSLYSDIVKELSRIEAAQQAADITLNDMMFGQVARIYAELADLVEDDILILSKVYDFNNALNTRLNNLDVKVAAEISGLDQELTGLIENKEQALQKELSDNITALNQKVSDVETSVKTLKSETNIKFYNVEATIRNLNTTIQTFKQLADNQFAEVDSKILKSKNEVLQEVDKVVEQIENFDNDIADLDQKITTQAKRISGIIALEPGSTTGDAELRDIRNGYNGLTHLTAGDAVRAVGNDLEDLKNRLPEFIPDTAVDGLYYDTSTSELYLTSKEELVGDPVVIVSGGGGGGSSSTVKVQNNLPSTTFTVARGNAVKINFTYTSYENEVATGEGTYFILINSKRIDALSGTIQHNIAKELDIAEYLNNGANTIKVTCTDQYGTARSLVYNISIIELKMTSAFDSSRIFNDAIIFRYKVAGQVEKTVHIFLDGEEISTKKLTASVHNSEATLNIPKQKHGCHSITAYMTATLGSDEIKSNTLNYEILCIEDGEKEAMIASVFEQDKATQGDLLAIPFQVYDPSSLTADVDLVVYQQVGGITEVYSTSSASVGRELSYWNTRQYPTGQAIFELSYTYSYYGETRTIKKTHKLFIEAFKVDVSPETDGLQVYLTSQGRANTEAASARDKWTFNSENDNEPLVTTTFENFNWKTNGWLEDDSGDICLRLNGDARATINFKPFVKDFKDYGKTIEFEFAVRDVNSRDAIVIDCFDDTRGLRVTPDTAFLQSSGPKVTCRFKDEERVRVSLVVEHSDSGSRFVSIYLDGILSGVQRYASDVIFSQVNALPITIGSSLCGVDIYNIRVYDKALDTTQVLKNYIADKAEPTTKLQLLTDNSITFTEDDAPDPSFVGKISYDKVKALGQIPIITFTGAMPTFKGDKKKNSVYMTFEDPAHPELSFTKDLLKEIDVQGTSSAGYVRKNWKIKLNEKRQHMPGAIPAKVFCIKVDYAEATGTHNTGTANYVETLYDRNQSIIPAQLDNPKIRTTIQGFPCIIFEKATEDSEPVFSSKGNFNYDKGAEDVFGFCDDYEDFGVECWEFCNNISDAVSFLGPIPDDWKDDFEPRYTPIPSINDPEDSIFDDIEGLIEERTNAEKGEGIFTTAQQELLSMLQADCIKNFKEMHDWVLSTATYKVEAGSRVAIVPKDDAEAASLPDADKYLLETPVEYAMTRYVYDTELYRLAKFKNEFTDYFDMHYSTMYYVFTLFALMVDQRAKNLFLTRWKNPDGKYRWYPYFYDNDTIFGINNVGALVFDYYHEDIDQLASSDVYNGQNSTLWNNFRLCFATEIEELYRTLRSDNKVTYDVIINQYVTEGSDKWSAAIYNADAEYKYISMARPDENGSYDANNLKQVRGPGEHHLRYFIANRLDYCDSKWYAGNYPSDRIVVRLYTPKLTEIKDTMTELQKEEARLKNARISESLEAVPASSAITVTPYSNMYAGVRYASGTLQSERLNKGESHTFSAAEGVNTNDSETDIYGASMLSSLGDLSNLYCDYLDLSKAVKLVHLKIGHADPKYHNDNIKSVTLGKNRLLKTLDIRNCSGLGVAGDEKTLDITGCQNIETIYAEGTNLASISLPTGGYIKTLHLPGSINSLIIRDHQYITDFSIESYENIRTLRIENCPTLDARAMLEACKNDGKYTVEYVYLKGFSWGSKNNPVDINFIKSLFPVYEDGRLVSGVLGLTADGKTTTDPAFLDGSCYIEELTGAEYAEIKKNFPYLKINFGKMISNVTFKYSDAVGNAYEETITVEGLNSALATCTVPVLSPEPAWPENDAFTYTLVGWSEMKQVSKGIEDSELDYKNFPDAINGSSLRDIAGDRTLYPVFEAIRKSYKVTYKTIGADKQPRILAEVMTPYGSDAVYPGDTSILTKENSVSPTLYEFVSWYPDTKQITNNLETFAQFTAKDQNRLPDNEVDDGDTDPGYTLGLMDLQWYDKEGIAQSGYTLNLNKKTFTIDECSNIYNSAIKIPSVFNVEGIDYTVVGVKGFSGHSNLELVFLPDTLQAILSYAFQNCYNLFEIIIPESVTEIGINAFQGCSKLTELFIPASVLVIGDAAFHGCSSLTSLTVDENNSYYEIVGKYLIDKTDPNKKSLVAGLPSSVGDIPTDIFELRPYCLAGTKIEKITSETIPEAITVIPSNAFSRCTSLTEVTLHPKITVLDATCFAWCENLSLVNLPEGLIDIKTYVFDGCALNSITIPSTVKNVLEKAFGDMTSLKEVIFEKRLDGTVPFIHKNAFKGTSNVTFKVPWPESYDYKYYDTITNADGTSEDVKIDPTGWGATDFTVEYNYDGGQN